jgi:parallel beta-helix repeat protein
MKRKAIALTLIPTLMTLTLVGNLWGDSAYANFMPLNIPLHSIEITADGNVTGTENIKRVSTDYEFTANISGGIVVLCDNITINGNGYSLNGNGASSGIFLEGRQHITIKNLTISNFEDGIVYSYYREMFSDCKNHALIANNIVNNKWGIYCYFAKNIVISGNVISNNSKTGTSTFDSAQIQINGNTLSENNVAVRFTHLENSNVYGNNFINNANQTSVDTESKRGDSFGWSTINWNYRRLGNFWSDCEGADANKDGICDLPYIIDSNNTDHYPLMQPFMATPSPTAIPTPTQTTEPFPTALITASIVTAAVIGIGLVMHFKKPKRRLL